MSMAWLRVAALGSAVAFAAPLVTTQAQDAPQEVLVQDEAAKPANWREVQQGLSKIQQKYGRSPSAEDIPKLWDEAWALVAAYAKDNPEAEDIGEAHKFLVGRAALGGTRDSFLGMAKDYLAKNEKADGAATVHKFYIAGGLGNEGFKKEATAELKKIDTEAKKDGAAALLAIEIRLTDAENRKDEAAKAKQIEELKTNKLISASKDPWVGRDAMRIALSASKAEIKEGEAFPCWSEAFPVKDLDGKEIKIADYKGKVVLIDFWAVWCGPCIAEMPNVVKTYDKYKDKGFDVIGLSFDRREGEAGLKETIKGEGRVGQRTGVMPWRQVYDGGFWSSGMAKRYGVNSIPFTVLIDAEGKVVATKLRGPALEAKVAELLGGGEDSNE